MKAVLKYLVLDNGIQIDLELATPEELVDAIKDVSNELAKRAIKSKS